MYLWIHLCMHIYICTYISARAHIHILCTKYRRNGNSKNCLPMHTYIYTGICKYACTSCINAEYSKKYCQPFLFIFIKCTARICFWYFCSLIRARDLTDSSPYSCLCLYAWTYACMCRAYCFGAALLQVNVAVAGTEKRSYCYHK